MSIASELTALNGYILGAYDEINTKGGTVPANKNMANLASAIATISGGGGGGGFATGTYTPSSTTTTSFTVTHGLGSVPSIILFWDADYKNSSVEKYQIIMLIGTTHAFATSIGANVNIHRIYASAANTSSLTDYIVSGSGNYDILSTLGRANRLSLHSATDTSFKVLSGRSEKVIGGRTYAWLVAA